LGLQRNRRCDDRVSVHCHLFGAEVDDAPETGLAGKIENFVGGLVPGHRSDAQRWVGMALGQQGAVEGKEG